MIQKQPFLTIEKKQLEVFKMIIQDANDYYLKQVSDALFNPIYLTEISTAYLKILNLSSLLNNINFQLKKEFYTCKFYIQVSECFTLLCSILPTNNIEYLAKIKELVLEHCVTVLKYYGYIDANATFKPALPELEPKEYFNPSTTINDFLQS